MLDGVRGCAHDLAVDPMLLVLILLAWLFYRFVKRKDHDRSSKFSLEDYFLDEHGKACRRCTAFMVMLAVSVWMIAWLVLHDKMTELYLGVILTAFVTPTVAKIFKGDDPNMSRDVIPEDTKKPPDAGE